MVAYPVARFPVQLSGSRSVSATVVNTGPGNLYLYRNSAVSLFTYDGGLQAGSSLVYAGELWGITDTACTVNVFTGVTGSFVPAPNTVSVSGGSIGVTGTVTTSGTDASSSASANDVTIMGETGA